MTDTDILRKLAEAATPDIVERLKERAQRKADHYNFHWDVHGPGWTAKKAEPDLWKAASEITALRAKVKRMGDGYRAIMVTCGDGSIDDDVVWFDQFTTLFDQCASYLGDELSQEEYEALRDGTPYSRAEQEAGNE